MNQFTAYLAYIGPALLIALKVGVVIGALGSAIEAIGLFFKLPRLVAFGKTLEAIGGDIPKVIKNVWAMLPAFIQKLIPFTPPAAIFLLGCFGAGYATTSCALFGSKGSVWPALGACAEPVEETLFSEVESILTSSGGNYEDDLLALAKSLGVKGFSFVECAVKSVVEQLSARIAARKPGERITPDEGIGVARGKAFLAKIEEANK